MILKTTITIVIGTRNRAKQLRATLDSIAACNVRPDWEVEVLVVDNGSTDETALVASVGYLSNGIVVHHLLETKMGKSYALNTGLSASNGQTVLFTDDDVRVPSDWITKMCQPIIEDLADAVQGGVRIAPHLEKPWLVDLLRTWVAAVEHEHVPPEGLVGANMAFARRVVYPGSGFDVRLGPGAAGFFDDTLFGWLLRVTGKRILYIPGVAVEHHFDPSRLTFGAFVDTARRMAASRAIAESVMDRVQPRPSLGELLRQIPGFAARCLTQGYSLAVKGHPQAAFLSRYHRLCLWGELRRRTYLGTRI